MKKDISDIDLKIKHDSIDDDADIKEINNFIYDSSVIHDSNTASRRKLKTVLMICGIFICLEAVGAYYSKSIAIFTDVAHLISDFIGFLISLISMEIATRKANHNFTYGFIRAELIGAFFSIILIWCLTVWIMIQAIIRFINKSYLQLNPAYMLITAIGALFVNLIMAYFLHDTGSGHNHGHSHCYVKSNKKIEYSQKEYKNKIEESDEPPKDEEYEPLIKVIDKDEVSLEPKAKQTKSKNKKKKNNKNNQNVQTEVTESQEKTTENKLTNEVTKLNTIDTILEIKGDDVIIEYENRDSKKQKIIETDNANVRAAWIHIIGDITQTIGVIIISFIIYVNQKYNFLDPFISILFAIIAVAFSWPIFKDIIIVLMDSVPKNINVNDILKEIKKVPGVKGIHDIHVWQHTQDKISMTCHVTANQNQDFVLQQVTKIANQFNIYHVTAQIENSNSKYKINCKTNIHTEFL